MNRAARARVGSGCAFICVEPARPRCCGGRNDLGVVGSVNLTSIVQAGVLASVFPAEPFRCRLLKLAPSTYGTASGTGMAAALVVAAIEYRYFKDAASATQLFTLADYGLHFIQRHRCNQLQEPAQAR